MLDEGCTCRVLDEEGDYHVIDGGDDLYHLGPPQGHRHRPTVGSYGKAFSYARGTPVSTKGLYHVVERGGAWPHKRYRGTSFISETHPPRITTGP